MELKLSEKELKNLSNDENAIRLNLISKALYNESLNFKFTEDDLKNIWFNEQNLILDLYMRKKVEPRVMVNENLVIEEYNNNKKLFEENNMNFEQARNYILERLTTQVNEGLFEDLVKKLMNEMGENVSLSKEDILFTKGDPNLIKAILLISVLNENAKKDNFFNDFEEDIDLLKKDARLNYYLNKLIEEKAVVSHKDVLDNMQEISKNNFDAVKNYSQEELFQNVGNSMLNQKVLEVRDEIIKRIVDEFKIEDLVKEYIK